MLGASTRALAGISSRSLSVSKAVLVSSSKTISRQLHSTNRLGIQLSSWRYEKRPIVVPPLAESLSEGDIKFEKEVGDVVREDELLANIETDKTSIPINSPVAGKIVELLVEDSCTVRPGQSVLVIDTDAAGAAPPPAAPKPTKEEPASSTFSPPPPPPPSSTPQPVHHQEAPKQPRVAAFAEQKSSVSVKSVKDELNMMVRSQSAASGSQPSRAVNTVKMNRMRQKIASRLKEAQNTYAMLTTFNEIDMSNLMELRQKYKDAFLKKHAVKLGFMSAFVKASAHALRDQPVVNAVIEENQILYRDYVDISVAVATPKGLVVPVLRNVGDMSFATIEKTINELGEKARNNALSVADMEGGTFTISNGGVFGSLFGTPIINAPQSAILGMHAINEKPVALNGQVVIRPVMVVALTYDHRLIDGREAVTFLKKIKEVIEDPRVILLDL